MPSRSRGDFASAASAPLMRLVFERPKGGRRPLLRSSADRPQAVAFVSADGGSAVSIVNTIQHAAARAGKRTLRTIGGRSHGQQSSAYNALIFLRKGTKLRSRTQRTQLRLPSWNGGGQVLKDQFRVLASDIAEGVNFSNWTAYPTLRCAGGRCHAAALRLRPCQAARLPVRRLPAVRQEDRADAAHRLVRGSRRQAEGEPQFQPRVVFVGLAARRPAGHCLLLDDPHAIDLLFSA